MRVPLIVGACVVLLAATVSAAVGLSSPAQAGGAAQAAAAASAAQVATSGTSQDGLQELLSLLFPPPPPPAAAAPAAPPPPPADAPTTSLIADAIGSSVPVYANPSGGPVVNRVSGSNVLGQREAFLVTDSSVAGWYQVELPVKPNGTTGWIQASRVTTRTSPYLIRVHQSQFKLDLYNNGQLQQSFTVAVGAPSTPTPDGNFFVWASQDWNSAPYAVGIFALSGFSPVLDNWPGGGRTGIHGWQDTSILGSRASHGCVRMGPGDFAKLLHTVPLGTPVEIQP
ncbi:MAG TPA: L,D-transpeptidase [Actinomycetota bacterium]|nr:L,D-transpeptidase [Actinomycetota bacterium]